MALTWSERLDVDGDRLIAHHFWGERSVALADVVSADTGMFAGVLVRTRAHKKLRSWVSWEQGNELWESRASRIAHAVMARAESAQEKNVKSPRPRASIRPADHAGSSDGSPFRLVRWREGYDTSEVDSFLAKVSDASVTSADVMAVQFRPVRLRSGYAMGEVDRYLLAIEQNLRVQGR